jgi:hypothetical protein
MFSSRWWIPALLLATTPFLSGQIKHTSVPLGRALTAALEKTSLTTPGSRPFHFRMEVSEPENPQSPYQGTIEEWWNSADQWRREVSVKSGARQTTVMNEGKRTERDEGDYFPLWLRQFLFATLDPVPDAAQWSAAGITIDQITLPDGRKSDACARLKGKVGIGADTTDAFWNICFQGDGLLNFVGSPRYSMEFHDYRGFDKKQVARRLVDDPEPGTKLVGQVTVLEDENKVKNGANLFDPLPTNDDRFDSVAVDPQQMNRLSADHPPIQWPTVRSGNVEGQLAMYIATDSEGRVREAWPLNSDNAGLEDAARPQVMQWKLKPAVDGNGHPVQVDGGLGFHFSTKIENPLPVMTGADIDKVVSGCMYHPILPQGTAPGAKSPTIRASVNEDGKLTGESFLNGASLETMQRAGFSLDQCHFKPWAVNGKATYYFVDFVFAAP